MRALALPFFCSTILLVIFWNMIPPLSWKKPPFSFVFSASHAHESRDPRSSSPYDSSFAPPGEVSQAGAARVSPKLQAPQLWRGRCDRARPPPLPPSSAPFFPLFFMSSALLAPVLAPRAAPRTRLCRPCVAPPASPLPLSGWAPSTSAHNQQPTTHPQTKNLRHPHTTTQPQIHIANPTTVSAAFPPSLISPVVTVFNPSGGLFL